jgi:hypothetical protein
MAELDEDSRRLLALATLIHLHEETAWMHRRVETVELLDASHVRRRVSVDFSIPETNFIEGMVRARFVNYLPLALLQKRPLVNFDVRDESGQSVPVLSKAENAELAYRMLRTLIGASPFWHHLSAAQSARLERRLRDLAAQSNGAEMHAMLFGGEGFIGPSSSVRLIDDWPISQIA